MSKKIKQSSRIAHRRSIRRKRRLIVIGLCTMFLLVIWGMIYYNMYRYVKDNSSEDRIANNIKIGYLDMSDKTKEEALQVINENTLKMEDAVASFIINEQKIDVRLGDSEISYTDADKSIDKALKYGKSGSIISRYRKLKELEKETKEYIADIAVNEEAMTQIINNNVEPHNKHAANASIHRNESGFVIEDEEEGTTTDVEKTLASLSKILNDSWDYSSFNIDVEVKTDIPTVKRADLESITDMLGSYSTDAGSGARVQNIQTGVNKFNGLILQPAEEVSFLAKSVPFTAENGYVEAGAYEEGRIVDSFGGGICQVSTTLYNAAIYAELDIVERYPHSMTVNYVNYSRDAAIAEGVKDLIIKNPYDTPIYIEGYLQADGQIVFNIYGKETRQAGRTIDFETEVLSTEDYQVTYKVDYNADLGSTSSSGNASKQVSARLWKVVYQDGVEVSRDEFNKSHYMRSDRTISVGAKSSSSTAISIIESAIGSQDWNTISAAISQAKAAAAAPAQSQTEAPTVSEDTTETSEE
ncbi:MAG: VanW family protein [Suipraeoptans sp.]